MKRKAFSLVELLIVIAILGIMAAIVLPSFQDHTKKAKEATAKDNLRILRTAIGAYAARNNGVPPGYIDNDPTQIASNAAFGHHLFGDPRYLNKMPDNPFNNDLSLVILNNADSFPAAGTGDNGWIYQPATRDIRLDWPGTDSEGVSYFSY